MRLPKFRVYTERGMSPVQAMNWHYRGHELSQVVVMDADAVRILRAPFGDFIGDSFTLMQFTGALDGRGREIYEGDILQYFEGSKRVVVWSSIGNSWVCMVDGFAVGLFGSKIAYAEVIGNIYQNPDLAPYWEIVGEEE